MAFNQIDIAILIIMALSSVLGLWRGLIKEMLALSIWIATFLLFRIYSEPLAELMSDMIENDYIRNATAFTLLLIAIMMIGALLHFMMSKLPTITGLQLINHSLGAVVGVAKGVIIVLVILFISNAFVSETELWQQSQLIPYGMTLIEESQVFIKDFNSVSPTP